ncbi:MAG: T9SS type A sorting domain-containing protein, partial [Bacteroidota bacterium]
SFRLAPTSVQEPAWAKDITVFPNPVKDQLNIRIRSITLDQVDIIDNLGRVLSSIPSPQSAIDISALPAGIYRLRLMADGDSLYRTVSKME